MVGQAGCGAVHPTSLSRHLLILRRFIFHETRSTMPILSLTAEIPHPLATELQTLDVDAPPPPYALRDPFPNARSHFAPSSAAIRVTPSVRLQPSPRSMLRTENTAVDVPILEPLDSDRLERQAELLRRSTHDRTAYLLFTAAGICCVTSGMLTGLALYTFSQRQFP